MPFLIFKPRFSNARSATRRARGTDPGAELGAFVGGEANESPVIADRRELRVAAGDLDEVPVGAVFPAPDTRHAADRSVKDDEASVTGDRRVVRRFDIKRSRLRTHSLFPIAVAAAGGRDHDHSFARFQQRLMASLDRLHMSVEAADGIFADLARLAPGQAKRPHTTMAR